MVGSPDAALLKWDLCFDAKIARFLRISRHAGMSDATKWGESEKVTIPGFANLSRCARPISEPRMRSKAYKP
jgi:hypothetical protein